MSELRNRFSELETLVKQPMCWHKGLHFKPMHGDHYRGIELWFISCHYQHLQTFVYGYDEVGAVTNAIRFFNGCNSTNYPEIFVKSFSSSQYEQIAMKLRAS